MRLFFRIILFIFMLGLVLFFFGIVSIWNFVANYQFD